MLNTLSSVVGPLDLSQVECTEAYTSRTPARLAYAATGARQLRRVIRIFKHRLLLASGAQELSVVTISAVGRSEIEECAEADASRMQARLSYVRHRHAARLHRQAPAGAPPALVHLTELCHDVACSCGTSMRE